LEVGLCPTHQRRRLWVCPTHHHRRLWLRIRPRVFRSPGTHRGRRPRRRDRQCQTGGVAGMATVAVVVETAARVGCSRVRVRTILTGRSRRQILLGMFCSVGSQHTHRVAGLENSFCCNVVTYACALLRCLIRHIRTCFCIHNFNHEVATSLLVCPLHTITSITSHHVNKR
jgi:hypothetical protein